MKPFKLFILEELQKQIILEMPHIYTKNFAFDLEFELRFENPASPSYEDLVEYLRQWYWGYSFLPKVKECWTGKGGFGGKREKLLKELGTSKNITFTSDELLGIGKKVAITYHFDGDTVTKEVPNKEAVKVIPWKLDQTESKVKKEFIDKLKTQPNIVSHLTKMGMIDKLDIFEKDVTSP